MPTTLTVMTLNLHKGFNSFNRRFVLHELRDAIRRVGADLVFLQEVVGAHHEHAQRFERWPQTSQYEFLADTLWQSYAYGRNAVYEGGHHGNAILSKFPIVKYDNIDVSVGAAEQRGLLHCELALPGQPASLHAVCVHLGLHEAERQRQLRTAARYLNQQVPSDAPVVFAGDFNDWRQRAHRLLETRAGLAEVFERARGRAARTFPVWWPVLRLDRIYVRNLKVASHDVLSRRPWRRLSDHAGLLAEVQAC